MMLMSISNCVYFHHAMAFAYCTLMCLMTNMSVIFFLFLIMFGLIELKIKYNRTTIFRTLGQQVFNLLYRCV